MINYNNLSIARLLVVDIIIRGVYVRAYTYNIVQQRIIIIPPPLGFDDAGSLLFAASADELFSAPIASIL